MQKWQCLDKLIEHLHRGEIELWIVFRYGSEVLPELESEYLAGSDFRSLNKIN